MKKNMFIVAATVLGILSIQQNAVGMMRDALRLAREQRKLEMYKMQFGEKEGKEIFNKQKRAGKLDRERESFYRRKKAEQERMKRKRKRALKWEQRQYKVQQGAQKLRNTLTKPFKSGSWKFWKKSQ